MSTRARHTVGHRLVAALALAALTWASAAVAWASPCAGDCPAMSGAAAEPDHDDGAHDGAHDNELAQPAPAHAHSCCPQQQPADHGPEITSLGCCGGDSAFACERAVLAPRTETSAAHQRAHTVAAALAVRPLSILPIERLPLRLPIRRSAAPPGERLITATVVLLI